MQTYKWAAIALPMKMLWLTCWHFALFAGLIDVLYLFDQLSKPGRLVATSHPLLGASHSTHYSMSEPKKVVWILISTTTNVQILSMYTNTDISRYDIINFVKVIRVFHTLKEYRYWRT